MVRETDETTEEYPAYNPYHTVSGYLPMMMMAAAAAGNRPNQAVAPPQQHYTTPSALLSAFKRSSSRSRTLEGAFGNLFSTAVISGSNSAPDLRYMVPCEGPLRVPTIRPLETLHNALSLYQLDMFLSKVSSVLVVELLDSEFRSRFLVGAVVARITNLHRISKKVPKCLVSVL